jgi:tetratricopeptide (TPR) repeat protein
MISHPNCSTFTTGARCCHPGRLRTLLLVIALSATSGGVYAGELEDCNGTAADKIEPACTAVINDASRPADDRLKAYSGRARLYMSRSKPDLASSDAEAALQLNPHFVPALLLRGYLRQRSGSFDSARADLDLAIELEPKNAFAFLARGNLRSDQKAWTEALTDFDQAIALRQDLAPAHVARARALVETGQLDPALGELNTALALNPNVPNAFFWRGQVYRRKGDIDHAIEEFSRAIAQSPQNERASYFYRGQLFSTRGDYARAIADFDKLLSLAPDNKEAQQQRQAAIAQQAELAKVATKPPAPAAPGAVTAPPSPPAAAAAPSLNQQIDQARLLVNQGNFAVAVQRLNPLLAADPSNEAALRLRALSFMRLSQLAEAAMTSTICSG